MTMTEREDEEETSVRGRPNAWFAEKKKKVEQERVGFSSEFRAVSIPRPGHQTVTAENTLGDEEHCWCGEPYDHDWPGKDSGAKHPRGNGMRNSVAGETLDRNTLRRYPKDMIDMALLCVNRLGATYKQNSGTLSIYPPDGSSPFVMGQRSGGPDVRKMEKWILAHFAEEKKRVEEEDLARLAASLNDPVEHPPAEKTAPRPPVLPKAAPTPTPPPVRPAQPESAPPAAPSEEWTRYHSVRTGEPTGFETNGTVWRCIECHANGIEVVYDEVQSIAGHTRMKHRPTDNIHGKEVQVRKAETHRVNSMKRKVAAAVEILMDVAEIEVVDDSQTVKDLEDRLTAVMAERDDLKARLALIQEAMKLTK